MILTSFSQNIPLIVLSFFSLFTLSSKLNLIYDSIHINPQYLGHAEIVNKIKLRDVFADLVQEVVEVMLIAAESKHKAGHGGAPRRQQHVEATLDLPFHDGAELGFDALVPEVVHLFKREIMIFMKNYNKIVVKSSEMLIKKIH